MSTPKLILTWIAVCVATAAITIAGISALNDRLGLQQQVAAFGKTR